MTKLFQYISWMASDLFHKSIPRIFNVTQLQDKSINASWAFRRTKKITSLSHLQQNRPKKTTSVISRFKRSILRHWISAALVFCLIVWSQQPDQLIGVANAASTVQPPLSTRGSQIIDSTGATVLLRGVNWFGFETEIHAPHGLHIRDYKQMLAQIKSLGYNVIRLPYSVKALSSSNVSGIDFNIGSNKDLQGKTPLQVMDLIITEAQRQGLMILLDNHRLNDYSIPELW